MKVLYVGAFRLPNRDAAAARVLSIGRALHELGHIVSFLSWGGEYDHSQKQADGSFRVNGMHYIITDELDGNSFTERINRRFNRGKKSLAIIKKLKEKPNVIITYNVPNGFNKKIIRYCHINGIKLIGDLTEWYDNNELKYIDIFPNYINMTRTYRKVKNLILISSFFKDYYNASHSILLPALTDLNDQKWSTPKNKDIPEYDGVTLIYAGNPAKKDKVHTVINVVNSLVKEGLRLRFIIIGIDKNKYVSEYSNLLVDKDLSTNIIFLGRVNQEEVPSYYKTADFMVLVRESNRKSNAGFPTKFAESYSAGVPVIANATSDILLYLRDHVNGILLKSDSCNDIADSLRYIHDKLSKEDISAMKREAKITGENYFDYRSYIPGLKLYLESLY